MDEEASKRIILMVKIKGWNIRRDSRTRVEHVFTSPSGRSMGGSIYFEKKGKWISVIEFYDPGIPGYRRVSRSFEFKKSAKKWTRIQQGAISDMFYKKRKS